ncbi:hypothetical protein CWT12_00840 [Actinomyces sp. 432]|uniref:hypothetical protein n=1 Tax=Actinomyces sp. 432 TaxID=2057798 RepID=UPI0013741E6B|nr:hypothetical protein [Actinomyces sp. 432]QHO90172.1 hypothetical protein CWT12_00840 [Actinomyces sp. 432]
MTVTDLVPVNEDDPGGSNGSQWGRAQVLVKYNTADNPNIVVNEYIANRIAIALGIPTPLGDLWFDPSAGEPAWVVAEIGEPGNHFPPPQEAALRSIPEKTRALMEAFDALIYNTDRHEENILADNDGHAWVVDHDGALFGDIKDDRATGLLSTKDRTDYDPMGFWGNLPATSAARERAIAHIREGKGVIGWASTT